MDIDLGELKRQSRRAAVLTIVSSLVVLTAFVASFIQTNRAIRNLKKLQDQTQVLETEKAELTADIVAMEQQKSSLEQVLQHLAKTPGVSGKAVNEAFKTTPLAATQIARVTIIQTSPGLGPRVDLVSRKLQSAGFIVLKLASTDDSRSFGTIVRYFFSRDANEAQSIASQLRGSGISGVTVQFAERTPRPSVRSYEVRIGTESMKVLHDKAVALQAAVENETKSAIANYTKYMQDSAKANPSGVSHAGPGSIESAMAAGAEQQRLAIANKHMPEINALLKEMDASPISGTDDYLSAKVKVHKGCAPQYVNQPVFCGEALQSLVALLPG